MPTSVPREPSARAAEFRARLDRARGQIAAAPDLATAEPAIAGLLDLIGAWDDPEAYAELERGGFVEHFREFAFPHVLAFTAAAEARVAAELARADGAIGGSLAANEWGAYAGIAAMLPALDLTGVDSAVMVGCGPLPDTLICLRQMTAIHRLVGVEREPGAAEAARRLVADLGLDQIEILDADGVELDYRDFDLVCPSVFARPRRGILERVAATASPGALVVFRDPHSTGTLIFEPLVDDLPARLEIRARPPSRPGRFMLRRYVLAVGDDRGPQAPTGSPAAASRKRRSTKSVGRPST